MSRHFTQALDISLNELRRSMVIIHNGQYAVDDGSVHLANPDIHAEDRMNDGEEQEVYAVPERGSHSPRPAAPFRSDLA